MLYSRCQRCRAPSSRRLSLNSALFSLCVNSVFAFWRSSRFCCPSPFLLNATLNSSKRTKLPVTPKTTNIVTPQRAWPLQRTSDRRIGHSMVVVSLGLVMKTTLFSAAFLTLHTHMTCCFAAEMAFFYFLCVCLFFTLGHEWTTSQSNYFNIYTT